MSSFPPFIPVSCLIPSGLLSQGYPHLCRYVTSENVGVVALCGALLHALHLFSFPLLAWIGHTGQMSAGSVLEDQPH